MASIQRLLTPREVAELLRVAETTLATWRCTGRYELAFVKIGRCVRYREADVVTFLEQRSQQHA